MGRLRETYPGWISLNGKYSVTGGHGVIYTYRAWQLHNRGWAVETPLARRLLCPRVTVPKGDAPK